VDLCDNIYINEIANMVVILESCTYSNGLHCSLGKVHNRMSAQPRVFVMILK
jgi:hypothetical protein